MTLARKELGRKGEDLAVAHLMKKNFQILRRNYVGINKAEIDIVAQDGDTLVFVEVKTLENGVLIGESPALNVTVGKQRQVIAGAKAYLAEINDEPYTRFDVVAVRMSEEPQIEHFQGAFTA